MTERCDVAVIGGGMAGMSVAAELAVTGARVVLLEAEAQTARHATGRSAATFLESYGNATVRALTAASRPLLDAAARDPLTGPLLTVRGLLWLAPDGRQDAADALAARVATLRRLDTAQVRRLCPAIRPRWAAAGCYEANAADIDVHGLHQHYLRTGRRHGLTVRTSARVVSGSRDAAGWLLDTTNGPLRAETVVNAAGAWADEVATALGSRPLGLTPLRRTAAVARPAGTPADPGWPLVCDIDDTFYFRPESGQLLISPADETPDTPRDARPEETDVALAIEAINTATTLDLRSVVSAWAGLRTFAPNRTPVAGYDDAGLCWLAGQGGYGIQLAAALAVTAAALVTGSAPPATVDADALSPQRLASRRRT